ncbi:MAG TPA: CheR family methyltransferase [Kofleriaceae bacterium]|nr:CheR family methyltransferase [Kofleriaceae bacterium]
MEQWEGEQRGERAPCPDDPFIVGVGARVGGIAALQSFFVHLPDVDGLAFVVVVHEQREHGGGVSQLLAGQTRLKVVEVADGLRVMPRHIHIAPPGAVVEIVDRVLRVTRTPRSAVAAPIDHFFRSLARDQGERAVGVLLAGSGSDGALGLREIKAACGMVMVQDRAFEDLGSPRGGAGAPVGDYVLPVEECPRQLLDHVQRTSPGAAGPADDGADRVVERAVGLLRSYTGRDFSRYRPSALQRRIERRMVLHRMRSPADYIQLLTARPAELDALFRELLIGVTSFFRDPEAFTALDLALDRLLVDGAAGKSVRAWVAGCATGEEAYSVAMLLRESVDRVRPSIPIRVFATDLDDEALRVARMGLYSDSEAADVSPARLERFFDHHPQGGYVVNREMRDLVVFAEHNLLLNPPFSGVDLICCRNVLIYLKPDAQDDVLYLFHHALRARGILFLGPSETLGPLADQFELLDPRRKLFVRRELPPGRALWRPVPVFRSPRIRSTHREPGPRPEGSPAPAAALVNQVLLDELAPPCVLATKRGDVIHIQGRTGRFLEPAAGPTSVTRLHQMARPGLELPLVAVMRRAAATGEALQRNVEVQSDAGSVRVDLRARRLKGPELEGLLLVAFEAAAEAEAEQPADGAPADAGEARQVAELRKQLEEALADHRVTLEELAARSEQMSTENEELQSMNEQLHGANEELESSREEMQSLNEALHGRNNDIERKIEEMSLAAADVESFLDATDVPALHLDADLRIKRYTVKATRMFNLIPSDIGRPLADLTGHLEYDRMFRDVVAVLRTLVRRDVKVRDRHGSWYTVRMVPSRTRGGHLTGVAITFLDIAAPTTSPSPRTRTRHDERIDRVSDGAGAGAAGPVPARQRPRPKA